MESRLVTRRGRFSIPGSLLPCPDLRSVESASFSGHDVLRSFLGQEAHDSFVKIAHTNGIGRRAVRRVRTDRAFRIDVDDLRQQYEQDKKEWSESVSACGHRRNNSWRSVRSFTALAGFHAGDGLWMHVDAAGVDSHCCRTSFDRSYPASIKPTPSLGTRIRFFPFPCGRGCSLRAPKRTQLGRSELTRVICPPLSRGRSIFTAIRSNGPVASSASKFS